MASEIKKRLLCVYFPGGWSLIVEFRKSPCRVGEFHTEARRTRSSAERLAGEPVVSKGYPMGLRVARTKGMAGMGGGERPESALPWFQSRGRPRQYRVGLRGEDGGVRGGSIGWPLSSL